MDGAARLGEAGAQPGRLGLGGDHAREVRQQAGVDVEQPPFVVAHEARREDAHEARQHDQRRVAVGVVAVDALHQRRVKRLAA